MLDLREGCRGCEEQSRGTRPESGSDQESEMAETGHCPVPESMGRVMLITRPYW